MRLILITLVFSLLFTFNALAGDRYIVDKPYYYVNPKKGPKRISTVWEKKGDKVIAENNGIRRVYKRSDITLIRVVDVNEANTIYNKHIKRGRKIDEKKVKYKKELSICWDKKEECLVNRPRLPIKYDTDINGDPFRCGVVYESVGNGINRKMRPMSNDEVTKRIVNGTINKGTNRYTEEDIKRKKDYINNCEVNYNNCKANYGLGRYDY